MSGRRPGPLLAAGCAAALVLLVGCTNDGEDPTAQPSSAGSSSPDAAKTSPAPLDTPASAYPAPASAQPEALPDLGTRSGKGLTLTLNAVRRVSEQAVVVEGTLSATKNTPLFDLAEPGYRIREVDGERPNTYEFSAVTLAVPADPLVYQPLRDPDGFCACTQGILALDAGQSMGVYTYVTAPAQADTVTVTVRGFAPFPGVTVQE